MALSTPITWIAFDSDKEVFAGKRIAENGMLLIIAAGTFGGGSLNVGYRTPLGNVYPTGVSLAEPGQLELPVGNGVEVMLQLTGATTPNVQVGVVAEFFQINDAL